MGKVGKFDGAGSDVLDTLKTIDNVWKGMGLTEQQRKYGIALVLVESSGIPEKVHVPKTDKPLSDDKKRTSIFYGLGQFNRDTWEEVAKKYNEDKDFGKKSGTISGNNPCPDEVTQAKIIGYHIRELWPIAESESKNSRFTGKQEEGEIFDVKQIADTLWRVQSLKNESLRKWFDVLQGNGTDEEKNRIHRRRVDKINSYFDEAKEIIRENDKAGNSPHSHLFPELADPNTPEAELAWLRQVEATLTEAHHHIAHFAGLHSGAMNPSLMVERNWPKQHQASRTEQPHIQTWIHRNPENPMPRPGGFPHSGFAPWPHAPHLPENPMPMPGHFPGFGPTPLPYAPQPSGAKPAPILCCRDPENHNILASQGFAAGIVTTGPSQDNPCPTGFVPCDTLRQTPTPQVDPGFSPQTRPIQLVGGDAPGATPPQTAVGAGVPGGPPVGGSSVPNTMLAQAAWNSQSQGTNGPGMPDSSREASSWNSHSAMMGGSAVPALLSSSASWPAQSQPMTGFASPALESLQASWRNLYDSLLPGANSPLNETEGVNPPRPMGVTGGLGMPGSSPTSAPAPWSGQSSLMSGTPLAMTPPAASPWSGPSQGMNGLGIPDSKPTSAPAPWSGQSSLMSGNSLATTPPATSPWSGQSQGMNGLGMPGSSPTTAPWNGQSSSMMGGAAVSGLASSWPAQSQPMTGFGPPSLESLQADWRNLYGVQVPGSLGQSTNPMGMSGNGLAPNPLSPQGMFPQVANSPTMNQGNVGTATAPMAQGLDNSTENNPNAPFDPSQLSTEAWAQWRQEERIKKNRAESLYSSYDPSEEGPLTPDLDMETYRRRRIAQIKRIRLGLPAPDFGQESA